MAIKTLQVTQTGAAVRLSTTPLYAKWAVFENNAAAVMRIGDSAVTTTLGYSLASGGAVNSSLQVPGPVPGSGVVNLADWWTIGTSTQLLDVVYDSVKF